MTDLLQPTLLGRTGMSVSRIGFGASYGAPSRAYEEAFNRGVNYFYWGSRRRESMGEAIRSIARRRREDLVVVVQSYSRLGTLVRVSVEAALRKLGLDYADVLLLGWFNERPAGRILDDALRLRQRGRVRHIALSSHRRKLFPSLIDDSAFDIWHARYNAAHRGAEDEIFPVLQARGPEARPGMVTYTTTCWGHLCQDARMPRGERTPTGTDCHRFALSHPGVDLSICGPSSTEHVREAVRALELGPMNEEELGWMRRIGNHVYGRDPTSGVRDGV